jgi:hypothetical protein
MPGALKAKVGGNWVLASSAAGGGGAEEVYIGSVDPGAAYDLWIDTSVSGAQELTPAWINPTFQNGWEDYGYPGWERAGYRKIGDLVYLRGLVKRVTGDLTQQPIFTVPAGYAPPAPLIFNVNSSATSYANTRFDVQSNGQVYPNDTRAGYAGFLSLSGVSWSVTP